VKAIVINKKPFGVTEFDNLVSIESGIGNSPIVDSFIIHYMVNDTAVQRTFNTADVIVQIM